MAIKRYTATELMVDSIFRAALNTNDGFPAGAEAKRRLLALAEAIDPVALQASIGERNACQAGFVELMKRILPHVPAKKPRKKRKYDKRAPSKAKRIQKQ